MPPEFDIARLRPRVEPTPRWVRVRAGDEWIADSRRALLLVWYGPGRLPTYCFPDADVRTDLLRPSAGGGEEHDVVAGGTVLECAAHRFDSPEPPFEAVDGHWTFTWDGRVTWFEEAFEVAVHARDPSKRVDTVPSERHVRVEVDGELVAESRRAVALFETALPTRWYFPPEDVRGDLLEPTATVTRCPYKGTARFWSVRAADGVSEDLAWSYPDPIPECPRIAGLIAFFNERVDLTVDGERQPRPHTPWSRSPRGVGPAR
jgi:uncharacterized protein (DUF427 family)